MFLSRAQPTAKVPGSHAAYKAIFPMITPTMKKRTTSASSRVLRPSSFPATADAGAGLLLCAVFLIRRPSSSWGAKTHFKEIGRAHV